MGEQKLKDIQEAVELYRQANELVDKANKMICKNIRGLHIVRTLPELMDGWDYEEYRGKYEVHVYSGILKLAKVLGVETEPEKDSFGVERTDRKALVVDGIKFFQLGEPTQARYCYK